MGMFSWLCRKCAKSILGPYVIDDKNAWMNKVILVGKEGASVAGNYDGYGRIQVGLDGTFDIDDPSPCIFHQACWVAAGKPGYEGPSDNAPDQGHFIDIKEYSHDPPVFHGECGRGTAEDGPDDPDCIHRGGELQKECATAGCGFCRVAEQRKQEN